MPRNAGKITPRDIAESLAMYNQGVEKVQATIQGYTGLVEAFRVTPGGGFKLRMEAWKDACQYTSGLRNALQRHFKKVTVGEWFSDGAVLVPCTVADSVQRTWGRGNRQPHPKWDDVQWTVVEVMNPADDSAESMSRPAVGDVEGSERPESDSYSRASQDVEPETTSPATAGLEQDNTPSNALSRVKEASASASSVSPLVGIPFSPDLYNFQSLRGESPLLSVSSSKGRKVYDVDEELERLRQIKNMQTNNVIFPVTPVTELNMQINAGADPHVPCNQVEMMDFDRTSFQMHQQAPDAAGEVREVKGRTRSRNALTVMEQVTLNEDGGHRYDDGSMTFVNEGNASHYPNTSSAQVCQEEGKVSPHFTAGWRSNVLL
uniref:Uncharacterized protein n=1 Tax=Guillardia theta TaxID=55529 RepID=A0A7S4H937_GUITH|mmetsp:Transcript_11052/g.37557  ORF Transcript_11052/g.37557 Transcript_11052/m.37557 type:complete len:376 (+) Transcript_11052:174-1301(+)